MTGTESVKKSHSNIFEVINTMQKEQVIKENLDQLISWKLIL